MKTLVLLLTACALAPVLAAADSPRQPPEKQKPAPPPPPAKTTAPAPAAVQKMASDFSQQREAQLHDRKALLENEQPIAFMLHHVLGRRNVFLGRFQRWMPGLDRYFEVRTGWSLIGFTRTEHRNSATHEFDGFGGRPRFDIAERDDHPILTACAGSGARRCVARDPYLNVYERDVLLMKQKSKQEKNDKTTRF